MLTGEHKLGSLYKTSWPCIPYLQFNLIVFVLCWNFHLCLMRKRKDKKTISASCDDPKRHIVLSGKRNIVGVEDKTDMSEDYNMFAEIPPFKVNTDPSIKLNDEDAPWIRHNRKQAGTQGKQ